MTMPRRFRAAAIAVAAAAATSFALPMARAEPAAPPPGCQGQASDTWINIVVEGVKNNSGLVAVTLYADNPRKFLVKRGSLGVSRFDAVAGATRTCVFLPGPGVYALAVYHDEDGSRKLTRSGLGLPEEGFGFSNNPSTLAGIPSFRSVRLNVPHTGLVTRIRLRYP